MRKLRHVCPYLVFACPRLYDTDAMSGFSTREAAAAAGGSGDSALNSNSSLATTRLQLANATGITFLSFSTI